MSEDAGTVETGGESSGIDAGVAELTGDFFSDNEPSDPGGIAAAEADVEGEGKSAEPGDRTTPQDSEIQAQPRKAQRADKVPAVEAEPQTYTYRGKKYSAEDIAKNPELLDSLVRSAEQLPNLQGKYQGLLEQTTQQRPVAPQAPNQSQSQGGVSPQEIVARFGPEAIAMANGGFLEPEFVQAFPGVAANMVGYRNVIEGMAQKLHETSQKVNGYEQERGQARHQQEVAGVATSYRDNIKALPELGAMFAPLKDPKVAQDFENFVTNTLNPVASAVVGAAGKEFLQRAAYAYFGPTLAQASQQQADAARAAKATTRRQAVGDAGGARPGAVSADPWHEVLAGFGV